VEQLLPEKRPPLQDGEPVPAREGPGRAAGSRPVVRQVEGVKAGAHGASHCTSAVAPHGELRGQPGERRTRRQPLYLSRWPGGRPVSAPGAPSSRPAAGVLLDLGRASEAVEEGATALGNAWDPQEPYARPHTAARPG
jgi:hypothetical protein